MSKYVVVFVLLALAFAALGIVNWPVLGPLAIAFLYPAFSFGLLAIAYARNRLGIKSAEGRLSLWAWPLLAPFLILAWFSLYLYRWTSGEPAWAEAVPGLYFGRRLSEREAQRVRELAWVAVLDLTSEFTEPPTLRHIPGYFNLPILDGCPPTSEQLRRAMGWLRDHIGKGSVYIHCALGHGRTGCIVVAYLVSSGAVATLGEAVRHLRTLRSGVTLNRAQRSAVKRFLDSRVPDQADGPPIQ